jgi:hypothetical protein
MQTLTKVTVYKTCINANKRSVFLNHTRIRCNWSILKFATCAVQIRYNFTFRKVPIRGISTLSRYFHIHTHSQIPCASKSQYLTFARLQNLIQWQCDTVNLTPPCKYFITHAKTLHAKYFMQHMQARRNKNWKKQMKLRNKTAVFMGSNFYFCNWKQKIYFYGGATTNYKKNKGQGSYIFYITKNCQVLQYGRH